MRSIRRCPKTCRILAPWQGIFKRKNHQIIPIKRGCFCHAKSRHENRVCFFSCVLQLFCQHLCHRSTAMGCDLFKGGIHGCFYGAYVFWRVDAFKLNGSAVVMSEPACHGRVVCAGTRFVAKAPGYNAGVVFVSFKEFFCTKKIGFGPVIAVGEHIPLGCTVAVLP